MATALGAPGTYSLAEVYYSSCGMQSGMSPTGDREVGLMTASFSLRDTPPSAPTAVNEVQLGDDSVERGLWLQVDRVPLGR